MNKKIIAGTLCAALLLLPGCGSKDIERGAEIQSTPLPVQSETETSTSSLPHESLPETEPELIVPRRGQVYYPLPEDVQLRMVGSSWTEDAPIALDNLAYLTISFVDFDGVAQQGEMVVRHSLAEEVLDIFAELYDAQFPMARISLIDDFGADDLLSMEANNTSAFCSRLILGTDRYSVHSYGAAIDINPLQNPYVVGDTYYPDAAGPYLERDAALFGMVVEGDACYNAFVSRGWSWGGHWSTPDYQHFEKDI